MFPFLIGRIRTKYELVNEWRVKKFPFLIGRIRTEKVKKYKRYIEFRFHSS